MSANLSKWKPLIPVVVVIALAVSFLAGMQVQKVLSAAPPASNSARAMGGGRPGGGNGAGLGRGGGMRPTLGVVASTTGTTLMITGRNGSTITVSLSGSPAISNGSTTGLGASDIKVGDTVAVTGTTGSDGTLAATRVLINPSFGGRSNGPASPQSDPQSE
jgi:hypothetical protein